MIIIKVQGGLGNQLLQYSIGHAIATLYNKEVAYDLSFFEGETKYTKRPYLLDKFKVDVRKATTLEIEETRYPRGFFSKGYALITRILNKYFFKTYYIGYNKDFFALVSKKQSLYLEGFWQSYKYYEKILEKLSCNISLKDTTVVETFKRDVSFGSTKSVSVHIRRGDYLNKGVHIQVLSQEYYKNAVAIIEKEIETPTYYIFSDDIAWVKEEMGSLFKKVVYVSACGLTDYEEFSIMKECNHAIIANSTFSWFSTLLTNRHNKIVVYSKDWKNSFLNNDNNICPQEWKGIY